MEENRPRDVPDVDTFAVVYEESRDADVVHVFGEFWFANESEIEAVLVRSVHIGRPTICNLLGCTYLDAAGLGVLSRARHALGSSFTILAPETGIVRRLLEIAELGEALRPTGRRPG
jgi:anti-anti-sigma factor